MRPPRTLALEGGGPLILHRGQTATLVLLIALACAPLAWSRFVKRDHRWPFRGPWMFRLQKELPQLSNEFNGIDFGHAHLAETLIATQEPVRVERARLQVLEFIFSSPEVTPDEPLIAPTFTRMVWELQKTFNWTHELHRSLYDLYASRVPDKDGALRRIVDDYLSKPEAITPHPLDHTGRMWSFPESRTFSRKFPKFNTQIWAYHWLQGGVYDVQMMGDPERQRQLMPAIIRHYHSYLKTPPTQWEFMPMMAESAPNFARRHPDVSAIFDNLHMLHDNVDDVLCRPDLYPTIEAKRAAILRLRDIYLHRNHNGSDRYTAYHMPGMAGGGHGGHAMSMPGPRPPTVHMVLASQTADIPAGSTMGAETMGSGTMGSGTMGTMNHGQMGHGARGGTPMNHPSPARGASTSGSSSFRGTGSSRAEKPTSRAAGAGSNIPAGPSSAAGQHGGH